VKQRVPLGESARDPSESSAVLSVSGLAGSKLKTRSNIVRTVEVTYGANELTNVTQEYSSHTQ